MPLKTSARIIEATLFVIAVGSILAWMLSEAAPQAAFVVGIASVIAMLATEYFLRRKRKQFIQVFGFIPNDREYKEIHQDAQAIVRTVIEERRKRLLLSSEQESAVSAKKVESIEDFARKREEMTAIKNEKRRLESAFHNASRLARSFGFEATDRISSTPSKRKSGLL